jgi:hypothetical protein
MRILQQTRRPQWGSGRPRSGARQPFVLVGGLDGRVSHLRKWAVSWAPTDGPFRKSPVEGQKGPKNRPMLVREGAVRYTDPSDETAELFYPFPALMRTRRQ